MDLGKLTDFQLKYLLNNFNKIEKHTGKANGELSSLMLDGFFMNYHITVFLRFKSAEITVENFCTVSLGELAEVADDVSFNKKTEKFHLFSSFEFGTLSFDFEPESPDHQVPSDPIKYIQCSINKTVADPAVREVLFGLLSGENQNSIAERTGLSAATISNIKSKYISFFLSELRSFSAAQRSQDSISDELSSCLDPIDAVFLNK